MKRGTGRCGHWLALFLIGLGLGAATPAPAAAQALSVQDFVSHQNRWKDLAAGNVSWNIEGRYAVISPDRLQFVNCTLPFLLSPDAFRNRGTSTVVEVTGKLALEENKLVFRVEKLQSRPSDEELLQSKRAAIDVEQPLDWQRVAEWAQKRGEFYEDDALRKEARRLFGESVRSAAARLDPNQPAELAALVEKARSWNVEEALLQQVTHDTLWRRYEALRASPFAAKAYDSLLAQLESTLPGATAPLPEVPRELAASYLRQPRRVFAETPSEKRGALARLFAIDVAAARILADAAPDGHNGFEIAARLEKAVPERSDLAREQEDRAIAQRLPQLNAMPRAQMLELAERLERRPDEEGARDIKRRWLEARTTLLRREGARGLADLAEQWQELLGDNESAAAFYKEAWEANPEYPPAIDWLQSNGFVLYERRWIPAAEVPVKPKTARELAIEQGRVEIGMSGADVQAALGVLPREVTRIASSGAVTELWKYDSIIVRLTRRSGSRESEVIAIDAVKAAAGSD